MPTIATTAPTRFASLQTSGPIRTITDDDFGVHWVRYPLQYDGVTTGAAFKRDDLLARYPGTDKAGWARFFNPGFSSTGTATPLWNGTTLDPIRLAELKYTIAQWKARGKKIFWQMQLVWGSAADPQGNGMASDAHLTWCLNGLIALFSDPEIANQIDAVSGMNEPVSQASAGGWGIGVLPKLQRIIYKVIKAYSPQTLVFTPEFQGGEGNDLLVYLNGTAASGVSVFGDVGTGTVGGMFFDKVAHHPYPDSLTNADVQRNDAQSYTARLIFTYTSGLRVALDAFIYGNPVGANFWGSRAYPEIWATEYNCSPLGADLANNTQFRYEFMTLAKRQKYLLQCLYAAFSCGYTKVFPYAVDHTGGGGPSNISSFSNSGGLVRVTMGSTLVYDADRITIAGVTGATGINGTWVATAASGSSFTLAGSTYNGTPTGGNVLFERFLLGGWHTEWNAIRNQLIGEYRGGFWPAASGATDSRIPFFQRGTDAMLIANASGDLVTD